MLGRRFSTPWMGCFAAAGVCIALQLSPLGFLLVFLTLYLSILFLNLGFILLAVDVLRDRQPRRLLILPGVWFGGYYAAALLSSGMALLVDHQLAASNAANAIQWTRPTPILVLSDVGEASSLVEDYGLDEVFSRTANGGGNSRRLRLVTADCPVDRLAVDADTSFHDVTDGGYPTDRPSRTARGLCRISDMHEPDGTPLVIGVGPQTWRHGLLNGYSQTLSVTAPGRAPVTLSAAGNHWTLAWIPMPMIGCHLHGGFGDSWDRGCSAEFMHRERKGERQDAMAVVAKALGLRAIAIADRFPALKWRCREARQALQAASNCSSM